MDSENFWKIRETQIPDNLNINSTYESYNLIYFSLIPHKAYF